MRTLAVLCLLVLPGCLHPAEPSDGATALLPEGTSRTALEPLAIEASGDFLDADPKEWTWRVEPGASVFRIDLDALPLADGAPVHMNYYQWRLVRNQTEVATETWLVRGADGPIPMADWHASGRAGPNGTVLDAEGTWTFKINAAPSAARYVLRIDVAYHDA